MVNDPKDEWNTKSYEEKINSDIENINTIEKRNKVYTKLWRTIYEVIKQYFWKETDIFPDDFKNCKNTTNETQFVPLKVKKKHLKMAMEQIFYAQVVVLRQKD